ncbi:MAG: thioredoxin [Acidobacteria bacterium]|nr:thioredoxin [Acidobacteriota bacterium]
MSDTIIRCPSCGQANRVPDLADGKKAVCGKCKAELTAGGNGDGHGHPVTLTDASFRSSIASGKSVVDLWAPWCGPCRAIAPVIEQLAADRPDIRFAKVNVDENPSTAQAMRASSIPLLVFFKDGVETGRVVGAAPRPQLEAAIRQYLG